MYGHLLEKRKPEEAAKTDQLGFENYWDRTLLETYEKTFTENDVLILSTDSEYYKYLEKSSGR